MNDRQWFAQASAGLLSLLPGLTDVLDDPALGDWSVRSLLGHTCRAFTTLETYLTSEIGSSDAMDLATPAAYYVAARDSLADPRAVAERGRQAGLALGDDPLVAARGIVASGTSLVAAAADDATVETPLGVMTFAGYLPTRAFEVTVHSLDLATASHQAIPAETVQCLTPALELAVQLASPEQQLRILLATTGRASLESGFSVL